MLAFHTARNRTRTLLKRSFQTFNERDNWWTIRGYACWVE